MTFFHRINYDYIKFSGKDRLDLLHRLSTNDVEKLEKFSGKKTILTTDKGRIVDLLTLYTFEDFVFATCAPGNSEKVIQHLDKYTIMEDFTATDMSGTHESMFVFGNDPKSVCRGLYGVDLNGKANNDFSIQRLPDGKDMLVAKNDDTMGGFVLIYPRESKDLIAQAADKAEEIDEKRYETYRIEAGVPKLGSEMGEHSNPLECNLSKYISFTKGCYIGQEVIARLDTYDKVSKHLVGIQADREFSSGMKILLDGKECGYITSAANSEKYRHVGLGFVRTPFLDFERTYQVKSNDDTAGCRVIELPFKQIR